MENVEKLLAALSTGALILIGEQLAAYRDESETPPEERAWAERMIEVTSSIAEQQR